MNSRTPGRPKRRLGILAAVALAFVEIGCSTSSVTVPSTEQAAQARRDLDAVRGTDHSTFYLGDTFQGLPVTGFQSGFVAYGTCTTGGDGGCAVPFQVQTGPLASVPLERTRHCQRLVDRRGIPTVALGGGIYVFTAATVVRIFDGFGVMGSAGSEATSTAAINALQNLDGTMAAGQALPRPSDDTLTLLDRVCGPVPTS